MLATVFTRHGVQDKITHHIATSIAGHIGKFHVIVARNGETLRMCLHLCPQTLSSSQLQTLIQQHTL